MRFAADENISGTVIRELRRLGHDVLSAKELMRSAPDEDILVRAQAEKRIVLTHDKDFGELAFRRRLPSECGVVLLRLEGIAPDADNTRALGAILSRTDWAGHFSVITGSRIRMRFLFTRA